MVNSWLFGEWESDSVLDAIDECRVFKITPTNDNQFDIVERCDGFFGVTITANQLYQLGHELIKLSQVVSNE